MLSVAVSVSAFANDNGNDPKIELTNSVKPEVSPSINVDFNLNKEAVSLIVNPTCGSGGDSGWTTSYYTYTTFRITRIDKRDCVKANGSAGTETREVEIPLPVW
jgi:hypothetical protein